jgi:hypothetical protein
MWFTWILRMSACQISEEFIHGPLSEDIQVRLEREKLSVRKHIFIINRFIFFSYFTLTGLMDIFLNNL